MAAGRDQRWVLPEAHLPLSAAHARDSASPFWRVQGITEGPWRPDPANCKPAWLRGARTAGNKTGEGKAGSFLLPGFMSRARGESLLGFCSEALFYPQILSLCGFFGDHSEEFLFFLQAYRPVSSFMSVLFSLHLGNQCISK